MKWQTTFIEVTCIHCKKKVEVFRVACYQQCVYCRKFFRLYKRKKDHQWRVGKWNEKKKPKPKKNPPSPPNSRFQRLVRSWEYAGEKRRREMSPSALFHEMPPEMRTRYTQGGPK